MKIALIHYTAAPVIGGVERIIEEHAQLLASHGHRVSILVERRNLIDALRQHDVAIVHNILTMPFDIGFTQAVWHAAATLPALRFIAWTHDVAAANPDLAPIPDLICRPAPRVEYIAISELRRRQLHEHLGIENARVIPNGISPARILALPKTVADLAENHRLFSGRHILLHPTRLLRRKNVETSIRITQALGDAVLLITGAPDPHNPASTHYAHMLREIAGPETIFAADHFPVGDAELSALYRLADALIFPSHQEGFGLPLLEARLHRLPAIYTAIEPLTEIAIGGFPIAPGESPAAIAERLAPWLLLHSARKKVIADYAWPAIYERHIASLFGPSAIEPERRDCCPQITQIYTIF